MRALTERPVYLNLFRIRLPVTGMVSFAHRISGTLLFLAIPFSVYLLNLSLTSEQGFHRVLGLLDHPVIMLLQLLLIWSLAHHLVAGIRFMLIDLDIGVERKASRAGAIAVVVVEAFLVAAFIAGAWL
jgi:succinate dehydrogenase / fumarate reductase cytochrome b subunit